MTTFDNEVYNTQREELKFSEYGRHVQKMVEHIKTIEDKTKRNRLANTVVNIMGQLNPQFREMQDFKQKLWDHLFGIASYDLDVESPFPIPEKEVLQRKPDIIPYPNNLIRFRFYGRNVQNMLLKAAEMEEGEHKRTFINLIASFMRNSCKNWNNENLSEEAISEHMQTLSGGKLKLNPEDITILYHTKEYVRNNNNNTGSNTGKNFKNKNFKNNNNNNRNNNNTGGNNPNKPKHPFQHRKKN